MSTVRITLTEYDVYWELSRNDIQRKIPESLLGQALQEEPNAPEIIFETSGCHSGSYANHSRLS